MSQRKSRKSSLSIRDELRDDVLRLSLNKDIRRREMDKVDMENHELVERIISSKSTFDLEKWKQEYKKSKKTQKIMSRKPDPDRIQQLIERGLKRRASAQTIPTMDNSIGGETPLTFGPSGHTSSQVSFRESLSKMKKSLKKKNVAIDLEGAEQYQTSRVLDGGHLFSISIHLTQK